MYAWNAMLREKKVIDTGHVYLRDLRDLYGAPVAQSICRWTYYMNRFELLDQKVLHLVCTYSR